MKTTDKPNQQEMIYGFPEPVHELAEAYIKRDILKCDSMLISDLIDEGSGKPYNSQCATAQFTYDNVENIYYISPKWINDLSPSQQALLMKYNFRTMEDLADFMDDDCDSGVDSDGNTVAVSDEDLKELEYIYEEWKYKDSEAQEIFEWWAVTKWLADELMEIGEPVLVNDYGNWWGRTCTGQAIILDGTIQQIAMKYI